MKRSEVKLAAIRPLTDTDHLGNIITTRHASAPFFNHAHFFVLFVMVTVFLFPPAAGRLTFTLTSQSHCNMILVLPKHRSSTVQYFFGLLKSNIRAAN